MPSSVISTSELKGGLAIRDSAKLIFSTMKNGARKNSSSQKKGTPMTSVFQPF